MKVPVFDLERAKARIEPQLLERWQSILASKAFVLGPEVTEFEEAFAGSLSAEAGCVAVANGTDALTLALSALEVGPEDEVLVPGFTFFASWESIVLAGARPVAVDIDPSTFNIDLAAAEQRLSSRTRGMVVVHLYGQPIDHRAVQEFCDEHGIWFVEDAAQAHGASSHGCAAGTLGRLASWSFYPSKNLGCFGDGGAVTSCDLQLLERVRRLANHGQTGRYYHVEVGTNSRLDALQAAVLNCRLPLLEESNERRARHVAQYNAELDGLDSIVLPVVQGGIVSANHLYTIRTARRDDLIRHLTSSGIGCAVHYPLSVAQQPGADAEDQLEFLPNSMRAASEVLSLPLFPEMTEEEVALVCQAMRAF